MVKEQLCQKLELGEVNTLVQTLWTNFQTAGDRLRIYRERFEELSNEIKVSQACESLWPDISSDMPNRNREAFI